MTETRTIPKLSRQQALNIIDNIINCNGYAVSDGDVWLGPRLEQIRSFIRGRRSVRRVGCMQRECWCHMDPKDIDFQCSLCGCKVVEK